LYFLTIILVFLFLKKHVDFMGEMKEKAPRADEHRK